MWGCAGFGDPPDARPRAGTLRQGLVCGSPGRSIMVPSSSAPPRRSSSGSQSCSGGLRRWGAPPGDTGRGGPRLWVREGSGTRRVNRPSRRHRSRAAISLEDVLARIPSRAASPSLGTPRAPQSPEQQTDAAGSWKPCFLGEPADNGRLRGFFISPLSPCAQRLWVGGSQLWPLPLLHGDGDQLPSHLLPGSRFLHLSEDMGPKPLHRTKEAPWSPPKEHTPPGPHARGSEPLVPASPPTRAPASRGLGEI